jgi:DNA invertase Pin-like site-specific DNA recombinase
MENNDKNMGVFENSIPRFEVNMKKERLVASIIEKAEQGDEEANKGRS